MATLYLIRHAEPKPPFEWSGSNDTRPLTETGVRQAQWIAEYLKDKGVTAIQSSPLERCMETAAIIGVTTGVEPVTDERLHIWKQFTIGDIEGVQVWVSHSNNIPAAVYGKGVSCLSCAHASAWRLEMDDEGNVVSHEYIVPEV